VARDEKTLFALLPTNESYEKNGPRRTLPSHRDFVLWRDDTGEAEAEPLPQRSFAPPGAPF